MNSYDNLPNNQEKEETARSFINAAQKLIKTYQYDSAFFFLEIAQRLADQIKSDRLYADLYFAEGDANYHKGQHKEAGDAYKVSIQYLLELNDTKKLAKAYRWLGVVKKHQGKYYESVKALNRALEYYHILKDEPGIAKVEMNMGNVLKNLGKTKQAKKKYKNALAVFSDYDKNGIESEFDLKSSQASCMNNLGNLYKNTGEFDSAYFYLSKTLDLRLQGDDDIMLAFAYHNIANLYSDMKACDSALFYMQLSLDIKSKYNNQLQIAKDYESYGTIYEKMKNWSESVRYYKQAMDIYLAVGYPEDLLDISKALARAYQRNGENSKSATMFQFYFDLADSLDKNTNGNLLQDELSQYEYFTDSIQSEQTRLQKQLDEAESEKERLATETSEKRLFYLVIIIALLALMIGGFLVSARRRLAQTSEYQSVLQEQNEELRKTLISKEEKEILLKEVHHRVKNNLQIINSLIRLQSNFMDEGNFQEKLMETENRIRSMGLIHEKLYKSDDLASLSIRNYIEELSIHILESYENDLDVTFKFEVAEQNLGIDSLIPLGLIINEILSNSLKYAFQTKKEGKITLELQTRDERTYLKVYDDGIGTEMTVDELREDSLGMDLIWSLTDQLDGVLNLNTKSGFRYDFEFPALK